jgi:hypothetical protein
MTISVDYAPDAIALRFAQLFVPLVEMPDSAQEDNRNRNQALCYPYWCEIIRTRTYMCVEVRDVRFQDVEKPVQPWPEQYQVFHLHFRNNGDIKDVRVEGIWQNRDELFLTALHVLESEMVGRTND